MAGNNQRRNNAANNRQPDDEGPSWAGILAGVAVGAAAIGGAAFLIGRALGEDEGQSSKQQSPPSMMREPEVSNNYHTRPNSNVTSTRVWDYDFKVEHAGIVITVDATNEGLGGFIRSTARNMIYYYSEKWEPLYKFSNEPDKFEMVNTLVALTRFEEFILSHRECDSVAVKTDSTFYLSDYKRDEEYKPLRSHIDAKLNSWEFDWEWDYVTKSTDNDMKIADKLSRGGAAEELLRESYPNYMTIEVDVRLALMELKGIIPEKHHVNPYLY